MNNYSQISVEGRLDSTIIIQDKEEAIPLITFDTDIKKFIINETAEHILRKLDSPLGVISVAGMYRTGKSYLLNRMLLNRSSGFQVGPSINPCTKGLWLWSRPLNGFAPDGTPLNVLVIDTEGIGATDEDQNHDNKIFTLGILLSSYFIFNSSGSIDENAINNLSFIVNITKNIQLNNSNRDDADLKEISRYLPSFMWVIRDFALKLIDSEGEPITSKEYLEKSLEIQRGYSESVESKNKIRSLIKEFFRERDCVTLVRPLTQEENLQNLSKMDPNKLRPEFLDQVTQLRKKVLHKIKPKTMNGKHLNGEMFLNVMKSYVDAINKGAVPVIENAWSFMCKNECNRAMNDALSKYVDFMNQNIKMIIPVDEKELKIQHKVAKKEAIKYYSKTAIGSYSDEYLTQLKNNIREKFIHYSNENQREAKKYCELFLSNNYATIKNNITLNSYKNFNDYKNVIENFINFYLEKAPKGPGRSTILYDFIVSEILFQSESFLSKSLTENETLSTKSKEEITKLTNYLNELKSEYTRESTKNAEIIKKLENEKNDIMSSDKSTKESLSNVIKDKETLVKELNEKIESQKREYEKKLIELKNKMEFNEEHIRECEKEFLQKQADYETNKLLSDQKIKFLEKTIEELTDKDNNHLNEIKNLRKETLSSNKEIIEKYEVQIKNLQQKYDKIQEKDLELEKNLFELDKRLKNEKAKSEETIQELNNKIEELNNIIQMNEAEIKSLESSSLTEKEKIKTDSQGKVSELKEMIENLNNKLKESDDKYTALKNKSTKEISMFKQNLEFAELQINDLKNQITEEKKSHEAIFKVLEEKNNSLMVQQEEILNQMNHLKMMNLIETEKLKSDFEDKERALKITIDSLTSQCAEWDSKLTKQEEEFEREKIENLNKINDLTNEIENILKPKIQKLESEKESLILSNKANLENVNLAANQKIEDILRQCRTEIEVANEKSEKHINDIRRHYEAEKMILDQKLSIEKENNEKHIQDTENYYIEKIREIEAAKDERIYELEELYENSESNHNTYVQHVEQEMALKNQEIDSLTKFLNDSKESIATIQQTHENILQTQAERFKEDKTQLNLQIEKLIKEIKDKERENGCLTTKNEQIEANIALLKIQLASLTKDYKHESEVLNEKINQNHIKIKQQYDEIQSLKSDYTKDIALKNQEIEFNVSKINELQKNVNEIILKNEEKIRLIKETLESEFNDKISSLTKEKYDLEAKFNQKKKEMKDMEITLNKDLSMLEKEKSVLNEKLISVNKHRDELAEALEKEREMSENKIQQLKNDTKREYELTMKENEMIRNKLKKLENDYSELSANYEKDSDLWATKYKFLEEQRNQAKNELIECQRKFESQLESLSKRGVEEKGKFESIQNTVLTAIEQKYKNHIKELQENFTAKIEEVNAKRKNTEAENKILAEKLKEKSQWSNSNMNELEKKLIIYNENEIKLKNELATLNEEKEKRIKELTQLIETERLSYKDKVIDLETKLREYESKRNNLAVDTVKEKAANDKEKQNMQREIESLNARIQSVEKMNLKITNENKELIRENEKLKKGNKVPSNNNSNIFVPKYSTTRNNSANKENIRNHSNTSFEERGYDRLDQLLSNSKQKISTRSSQKSESEHTNNSILI